MVTRKNENIFIYSIVGGVIGAVITGLLESIILTLHFNWQNWNLPFTGLLYYGLIGLIIGAAVGITLMLTKRIFKIGFNGGFSFILSGGGATAFCTYHYIALLLDGWGWGTSIPVKAVGYSILAVIAILIATLIYFTAFKPLSKKGSRVLSYLAIAYTALLAGTFILSEVDTGWGYEYNPYENNEYVEQPEPKYVFLIILDATRFDWLSIEGYDIETPNIQSLADDGITFTNAIANSYWTKPTMASIFTSVLPKDHETTNYTTPLNEDFPVLAEQFKEIGYYTAGITTNVNLIPQQKYHRGFHNYTYLERGTILPFVERGPRLNRIKFLLRITSEKLYGNLPVFASGEIATEYSKSLIDYYSDYPLFAYIHYMDPHGPYYEHPYNGISKHPRVEFTPEDSLEVVTELYEGEIEYNDKCLGELFEYLKETGIYDSSLIVLTSDHGEEFFEHYCWSHIIALWEQLIHTPLIIKPPFSKDLGKTDSSLIQQLDIAPTLIEYAGGESPSIWQGQNIFDSSFHNDFVVSQCDGIYSIRTREYKMMKTFPDYAEIRLSEPEFSHIDKRAIFPDDNLFNIVNDPAEKNNLAYSAEGKSIMDSLIAMTGIVELMMLPDSIPADKVKLDKETIEQLKAIGYMQ